MRLQDALDLPDSDSEGSGNSRNAREPGHLAG